MRIVIVGGGILGLATARLLSQEEPGAEIVLLEKESQLAQHQTSHNSGVVHAGLYYAPGSLKARLCRRGTDLLRELCSTHGVEYLECGKLVIAHHEREIPHLDALEDRAQANEVPGLTRVDGSGIRAIEPHATGLAALHSPQTAIVDFHQVALAIGADATEAGASIRTSQRVIRVESSSNHAEVWLAAGARLPADLVIVCAGLQVDRLARASGQSLSPRIIPFRGEYWQLRDSRLHLVSGLIYPVPDPTLPFLGIHLTRTVHGTVLIGPNALLSASRENYGGRSVNVRDFASSLAWPGTPRLMRRHWRAGIGETLRAVSRWAFVQEARNYVPELQPSDVVRARAGIRAQAVDRDGTLVDDFRLTTDRRVVWVRNAPSPAATSSLAIAEEIVERARSALRPPGT
jgi:(S)-2-hydroxyglutarate dehydrogenase